MCSSGLDLSYESAESWETATYSAYTILFTTTVERGCTLYKHTIAVTVGIEPGARPRYGLRERLPFTRVPIGDCKTEDSWREETTLDGAESAVRVVLVVDRVGKDIARSKIVVRRASPTGWDERVLSEPAPRRYVGGRGGTEFALAKIADDYWVISSHDRTDDTTACKAIPGQTVWTWDNGWSPVDGRDALSKLATEGLWRYAGQDAWFLVLNQDDPFQTDDVEARLRRMQRKNPQQLLLLDSSDFPGLNAGYVIVSPAPFTSAAAAEAMRHAWGRRAGIYVKQAWEAQDPCE
jgi:hypothetical protein